jgi:hypothetical protein
MNKEPLQRDGTIIYICLRCASIDGGTQGDESEEWWWRHIYHDGSSIGKIGPFCSESCTLQFHLDPETPRQEVQRVQEASDSPVTFTEQQLGRMTFEKHRLRDEIRAQIEPF